MPFPCAFSIAITIAGTVTTLYAVAHEIDPYDAELVHGGELTLSDLRSMVNRLFSLPLEKRRELPGLQPKRADVICAGALVIAGGEGSQPTACLARQAGPGPRM